VSTWPKFRAPDRAQTAAPRPAAEESADHDRWGPVRREPLNQIRKTIAAHMTQAAGTIPHVTHVDEADVTDLDHIRRTWNPEEVHPPIKVTMLPFIIKAVVRALKAHPRFNASFDAENEAIVYKQYISIGIAVDTDRGLIVPVLRDVDRMSILEIASAAMAAAERIRSARFDIEELRGGTFTISNVGAIGGIYSTPIIHHPEVAILLVGRARMQPVYVNGSFEPRRMLPLNLAYDHRVLDGAQAARFMNDIVAGLEAPGTLLLAP
jgi:pyruvate dehydrogenase E2 component (dihydrolipoamide acetyltransferase)